MSTDGVNQRNDIVTFDDSHVTMNNYLYVQNIVRTLSSNIFLHCAKRRTRYDSEKVVVIVVIYTWKPDHLL